MKTKSKQLRELTNDELIQKEQTFKKELFSSDHFYVPYRCFTGADEQQLKAFYAESLGTIV